MSNSSADSSAAVIGWHDSHCASASALDDSGRILFAAAEERYTKRKLQKGFPARAMDDLLASTPSVGAPVCYTDLPPARKLLRNAGLLIHSTIRRRNTHKSFASIMKTGVDRALHGQANGIVGEQGDGRPDDGLSYRRANDFCDHHTAHAASAYYFSGFDQAIIVTVDGVGDCLSGSVFEGAAGRLRRVKKYYYNELTAAADYEVMTAMLGFDPDRHCGKVTGLAALGRHNDSCIRAVRSFFDESWRRNSSNHFDALHGPESSDALTSLRRIRKTLWREFSREDLAFAIQHLAEHQVITLIKRAVPSPAGRDIALAGGLFANVRINQKIKKLGFRRIFVQPAMDDGGLSLGAAVWWLGRRRRLTPRRLPHVFVGPAFDDAHIAEALGRAGVAFTRVDHLAGAVAKLVADGHVVARFDGRMEFGPRALGNRSILYDTRDPSVNQWLNRRLKRTEFMPFAPATLADQAHRMYRDIAGCEHTAEFMTITFDCTDEMKRLSPAVVHVDGTARAQLVTAQANPGLYEIIDEYRKLTGIPSIVNTSFNMHESPIVRTPEDAIKSFQQGRLDYLAIGPFLVKASEQATGKKDRPRHRQAPLVAG